MTTLEETAIAEMRKDSMLNQEVSDEDILIGLKWLSKVYEAYSAIELEDGSFEDTSFKSIEEVADAITMVIKNLYGTNAADNITEFLNENVVNDQMRCIFLAEILDKLSPV